MKNYLMLLAFALLASSCHASNSIVVTINGNQFICEVADTDESRAKGLMHRRSMAANKGMLFIFPTDQMLSFWMKDTNIPLTIAYIDSKGIIRDIIDMQSHSLQSVKSSVPVRYALELNQGAFEKHGIKVGDKVIF